MQFREKIDKILSSNKLGIDSPYGLEVKIGASPGSISKYYKKGTSPGRGTIKKILDGAGVNPEWWESGKGEIFIVKGTSVPESDKKNTDRDEISILIKNLNRYGELNEHLLSRIKDLEDFIKSKGLAPPV